MSSLQEINDALLSTIRHTFIKIELLDLKERAIGSVEGEAISGSVSLDGDSVVRRTLNLVFITTDNNYKILETSNPLSINKKIKLLVGIQNLDSYANDKIIWISYGIYVMSKCTSTASVQNQQISITAQDKMCLHNGDISGAIEYTTRLDSESLSPSFMNYVTNIQDQYALLAKDMPNREKYLTNIDANLNTIYREVQGENSNLETLVISMLTLTKKLLTLTDEKETAKTLKELSESITGLYVNSKLKKLTISEIIRYAAVSLGGELNGKVVINDVPEKVKTPIFIDENTIGFKMIKYIYPGELTLATGQPVSTVYEKCKEALGGNYEYFYDLEGNFIFQEIKNYLNNTTPSLEDLKTVDYKYSFGNTPVQFDFSKYNIVTSYISTPSWNNIKNDFYVWGTNEDQLIGYHLVIDDKPNVPKNVKDLTVANKIMDWREYIVHDYDIGVDHFFVGKCYIEKISEMDNSKLNNVCCVVDKNVLAPQYRVWTGLSWDNFNISNVSRDLDPSYYYKELKSIWIRDRYKDNYDKKDSSSYTFNFDIIEGDRELSKFSINTIGRRKFPIDDSAIRQVYPTIIEDILVYYDDEDLDFTYNKDAAIKLKNTDDFKKYKAAGNIYKDAFSTIKELLFRHTTYNEQLEITSVPIYNLDVNRRAYVYFEKTNTNGYFLIKKININLDASGIMTTSLIKTEKRDN